MNSSTPVINRKVIVEYHLLGSLLIASYLIISLQTASFLKIIPIVSIVGLFLVAADVLFNFKRPIWLSGISIIKNQTQQFVFDLSPYIFTAILVMLTEAYMPLSIVVRAVIAIVSVGIFVSMGIAFELEYDCIKSNMPVNIGNISKIAPSALKLRYFLLALTAVAVFNFIFSWIGHLDSSHDQQYPMEQDFMEFMFIGSVVVGFSIHLFYLYNRNFIYVLGMQVNALRRVEEGSFDVTVPIVSDDELALLASYHNTMIERLRDRERLYRTLERSVGANIMNKLLNTDEQTLKQGQAYDVAILFCDLRGFTSLGESASAEEIILFLNVYFANVSGVISEHNGIINKFMGDAVLAIFGLEGKGNPVDEAVCAGLAIIEHSADIYMPNAMHPETGVGIDFGSVIGGTIGSEERYEYTIIGDAVNRASRLEGLSKRLDYSLILSQEAYDELSEDMRLYFSDLGSHKVRGRNMPVTIFGSVKKQRPEGFEENNYDSGRRERR